MPPMSRRVWIVLLALSLPAFLFVGALHSVHHLDSDADATACWVAGVADGVSIVSPAPTVLDALSPMVLRAAVNAASSVLAARPAGASRERAPPVVLSA